MLDRGSASDEGNNESFPPQLWTGGLCVASLNIGGRNSNPVEFVLEGDTSDVGTASAALGKQLFEAMRSDTAGPGALGEQERIAVDALLANIADGAENVASYVFFPPLVGVVLLRIKLED